MRVFECACGVCGTALSVPANAPSVQAVCGACGASIGVEMFPALLRGKPLGRQAEAIVAEDESSCFFHPGKQALTHCDSCGRFLCAVCDIDMAGQHLCALCIETGVKKDKIQRLKREHVYYDSIALAVAVAPAIFIWPTLVTAPIALYLVIRQWKTPLSVAPRGKWRFVLAAVIAVIELVLWAAFGLALAGARFL